MSDGLTDERPDALPDDLAGRQSAMELFAGPGEVCALARTRDWGDTPLGWPDTWSPALRIATRAMLRAPHPICLWSGPEYALVYNDAYRRILAAKHPAALGQPGSVVWAEIWAELAPQFAQVSAGGPPVYGEDARFVMARLAGGRTEDAWFSYSLSPLWDEAGHIVAVLNISPETTARVRAEEALAAERERLRTVILSMPSPLALHLGPEHRFELVNAAFRRISGGGRDDTGLTVREAFPELSGQGIIEALDRVWTTGEPWVGAEIPIRYDRDGSGLQDTWYNVRYEPLHDADGKVAGVLNFAVDVTDQVRARRQIERLLAESEVARAEAERANRARSDFLATMSHELRTPLNAIGGYAELLALGITGPVSDAQRAQLERIQASQRHLLGLVNEVLDLSKIDAGAVSVAREAVAATIAVDAALALVRPQAAARGVTLGDGCDAHDGIRYLGDEPRVRQILVNLLANAVKFTPSGGRVDVSCAAASAPRSESPAAPGNARAGAVNLVGGPYVVLRVTDTGVGIAMDQLERIFEPFTQAGSGSNPYTRTVGGTGLGLTISRRLARLMGGDLTVVSTLGAGSTFTLWLPMADRRAEPRPAGAPQPSLAERVPPAESTTAGGASGGGSPAAPDAGLARLGEALLANIHPIVRAWVARVRADPSIPTVTPDGRELTDAQIEDHAPTFVSDVALALRTLAAGGANTPTLLRDGTAILATVSERHGAQRARLGWPAGAVARELAHLGAELDAALGRAATSGEEVVGDASVGRARDAVARLIARGTRVSLGGHRLATPDGPVA